MKIYSKFLITLFFFLCSIPSIKSQVLLSLLFGDNLNTGQIEFGLDGGLNLSSLTGMNSSEPVNGFHLGFYFDIRTKNDNLKVHTGVIVNSPLGTENIPKYSTGDSALDNLFANGKVDRHLRYFNTPVLLKYYFSHRIYAEGGIQLGLIFKGFDKFIYENGDNSLEYTVENREQYHPLDAGFVAAAGWRILKGYGMNLGVRYYYGVVDILIDDSGDGVYNRSLYFALGIPIGVAKAREREKEKEKLKGQ
jgi:hypothetical protein